ncbi:MULTISPECIES: efflux transporter outer membrane subunit [unclassified Cupriavidus]|uniref:efflux transporter outer membrane subunit n=1 Tax=unclassified Cupriavidus TaxID=2640874 RepID=UPI001C008786|nr:MULTISPECIES: efflux transporter outer membrane subunit [unclassified Cupriavidus]MCA3183983.1 efflux transporter outer membrane subunit [Cupriavidus sp.]MCA3191805.1 efflux transporter outer membrane subunit [Cupriavidus sp.]MCA3198035.1 efflux transporter outer membrane subunit [Cupriavidus sp.]MCA3200719.1 efflux transporter outer membrane subunit [Cupriavidus sp.]MCA3207754.1 efflux transporter outer membrane subunit [Cupriavidus sp.]
MLPARRHSSRVFAPGARTAAALAAAGLVTACAVGPDFHPPAAPDTQGYAQAPLAAQTTSAPGVAGNAQQLVAGMDIPEQWWTLLRSEKLDRLIASAMRASPTVTAAQAALRQAQAQVRAQQGAFFPTLQGSYSPSRQRNAVNTLSPTLTSGDAVFNLHTAQLTVSYVPDVFGLNRRQVESLQALEDAQRFEVEATYLTLASNISLAAIQEASLRAQIDAQEHIVAVETRLFDTLQKQLALGYVSGLDVAAARTQLAQAEQALPGLRKQLALQRDLLSALAGRLPAEPFDQTFTFADFTLPGTLPVSLPSELVRQRPDVRAAEAQLHSATALVGVSIANMLPQLTITGAQGGAATVFSQMFATGNVFWSLAGNVAQTFFAGGTLIARKHAADAALDQAEAQYRGTVINAFQNVADTLHAIHNDADTLKAAQASEQAARTTLDITQKQLSSGFVNVLAVLNAEQAFQTSTQATAQAQAARYADTVALYQALGGGWWNRPAQADAPPATPAPLASRQAGAP